MFFSIVIPVYNRPDEVGELLESLLQTDFNAPFEILIIEDGSSVRCENIVSAYLEKLNVSYYFKENSGPGDSRNFGMKKAKGDYFLIFDSDCLVPKQYLRTVSEALQLQYTDCFGGPDRALESFSDIQKAINFAMTSVLSTGGIRGASEVAGKFQPRSFNMGLSKKAFEASGGFGNIHPGEDPDLSIRLRRLGFETKLIREAYVFHKRRIDLHKFSVQVNKFGKARPILNEWHSGSGKLAYYFPSIFIILFFASAVMLIFGYLLPAMQFLIYFSVVLITAAFQNKSIKIGILSVFAVWRQFFGYGTGFLKSLVMINILKRSPEKAFPELFF